MRPTSKPWLTILAFLLITSLFALTGVCAEQLRYSNPGGGAAEGPTRGPGSTSSGDNGFNTPSARQQPTSQPRPPAPARTPGQNLLTPGTRIAIEIGHNPRQEPPPLHPYLPEQLKGKGGKYYVYVDIGEGGTRTLSTNDGPLSGPLHLTPDVRDAVLIDVSRPEQWRQISPNEGDPNFEPYYNHYRNPEKGTSFGGVEQISVDKLINDIAPGLILRSPAATGSASPPAPAGASGARSTAATGTVLQDPLPPSAIPPPAIKKVNPEEIRQLVTDKKERLVEERIYGPDNRLIAVWVRGSNYSWRLVDPTGKIVFSSDKKVSLPAEVTIQCHFANSSGGQVYQTHFSKSDYVKKWVGSFSNSNNLTNLFDE